MSNNNQNGGNGQGIDQEENCELSAHGTKIGSTGNKNEEEGKGYSVSNIIDSTELECLAHINA